MSAKWYTFALHMLHIMLIHDSCGQTSYFEQKYEFGIPRSAMLKPSTVLGRLYIYIYIYIYIA